MIKNDMNSENLQQSQNESEPSDPYPAEEKLYRYITEHYIPGTSLIEWNDWKWQVKNSVTSTEELFRVLGNKKNDAIINMPENHLPFRITPYFAYLLSTLPSDHPLYRTIIPSINELNTIEGEGLDPLHEKDSSPVPNIVHRYPDRALFLVTGFCSAYCRYSLLPETKILMSDFSQKNIEDVIVGDRIISDKGNVCEVYDVFSREYNGEIISIQTNRNLKINTTQEHPFLSIKRENIICNKGNFKICKPRSIQCEKRHPKYHANFNSQYNYISNLKKGDFLLTPKLKSHDIKYDNINMAYLIGLYIAEGDLPVRKNGDIMGVRFSFGYDERNTIVKKLEDIAINKLKFKHIYIHEYEHRSITSVRIVDNDLRKFLFENCGMYSNKKQLSNDLIFNSTDDFKYYLLKGMMDGDGHYGIRKLSFGNAYSLEFNTVSETLSNQIFMMLIMLNYMPSIYESDEIGKIRVHKSIKVKNQIISKKIKYSIRLTNKHDYFRFLDGLKFEENSQSRSFINDNHMFSQIEKYEKIPYSGKTWDLSIKNDETYIANFLSVHNCTRTHMVSQRTDIKVRNSEWEEGFQYIESHPEIRDVIVSGGDPLTLRDDQIDYILRRLRNIKHVEIIRIGTKVPVVMPMRITLELMNIIKKYHPVYMSIHFTHPDELSEDVQKACNMIADAGIPMGSQSVLLKGINDDVEIFRKLMKNLLSLRVRPYYIFSCDHIPGSHHFHSTIDKGLEIINSLRGYISGYGCPQFVVDTGKGKISLLPNFVKSITETENKKTYIFRNYKNEEIEYIEVK